MSISRQTLDPSVSDRKDKRLFSILQTNEPGISYSGRKKNGEEEKTLAGVHNISETNLRKALGLGGLANPSVAVINTATNGHPEFGEISLILPSDKIDSRRGDNAGTWTNDVWTPTYPKVRTTFTAEGRKSFNEMVDGLDADETIKSR